MRKSLSIEGAPHILATQQFTPHWLTQEFFPEADLMKERLHNSKGTNEFAGSSACLLFYEPSTRTRLSFQQAAHRIGMSVAATENAKEFSSAIKGESIEDTARTIESLGFDAIVIRHHEEGSVARAAKVVEIPVINAGDGRGQHPTQALLDAYTIKNEIGRLSDLNITLVGDLANGRTTRSLTYLMSKFSGNRFSFVAPSSLQMNSDMLSYLDKNNVRYSLHSDLAEVAGDSNVVYLTRAQKERMTGSLDVGTSRVVLDDEVMARLPEKSIIMHPLPRSDDFGELPTKYDGDSRVKIFAQAGNGVPTRMALLAMVLRR